MKKKHRIFLSVWPDFDTHNWWPISTATVGNVPVIIKDFVLNILVMLRILDWVDSYIHG
jgi:hypothetical protein